MTFVICMRPRPAISECESSVFFIGNTLLGMIGSIDGLSKGRVVIMGGISCPE